MLRLALVCSLLASCGNCCAIAQAQCHNGQYDPPGFAPAAQSGFEWRTFSYLPADIYLYDRGRQVGAYHIGTGQYRSFNGFAWSNAYCPTAPPAGHSFLQNYGIDQSGLRQPIEALYSKDGWEISEQDAYKALDEAKLPDDASKLRLTVIGSAEERKPLLAELDKPENADIKSQVNLWAVDPDHWSTKESASGKAMYAAGHPAVYLQAPSGKVLHRQDGFRAGDLQVIRKLKDYDARRDPDLRSPMQAGFSGPAFLVLGAISVATGLVILARRQRATV